jgi:hypothetical protein
VEDEQALADAAVKINGQIARQIPQTPVDTVPGKGELLLATTAGCQRSLHPDREDDEGNMLLLDEPGEENEPTLFIQG